MRHSVRVIEEKRAGMRLPEFRVICHCGWEEKAQTYNEALGRGQTHINPRHRLIKKK